LIVDGVLAGYWKRRVSGAKTEVELVVKNRFAPKQHRDLNAAADRLVLFSGESCSLVGHI